MSSSVSALGTAYPGANESGLGATTSRQPPSASGTTPCPSQGRRVLALRPACANWIPATLPCWWTKRAKRSEEHTSELQSQSNLVCRLLLEKKKKCTATIKSSHTPRTQ